MNKSIKACFVFMFLLTGCIVYNAQITDIPLIDKKNDLRVEAGASVIPAAHATISYGLTDKFAIQAYGNYGENKRYMMQAAAGCFKDIGSNRVREIYFGYDYGEGSAFRDASAGHLSGNYQVYFAQFNIGKKQSQFAHMDYGLGIKTGILHSNLFNYRYYDPNLPSGTNNMFHDNSFVVEPGFFARLGGERLKFDIKFSSCWLYKFTNRDLGIPYAYLNLGIGLNFNREK